MLLSHYEVMHTQSLQHVAEDLVEALHNWEMRENLQTNNESLKIDRLQELQEKQV